MKSLLPSFLFLLLAAPAMAALPDQAKYDQHRDFLRSRARGMCKGAWPSVPTAASYASRAYPARTIYGMDLPRTYAIQYRGIGSDKKQMDPIKFVKAAMGDASAYSMTKHHYETAQRGGLLTMAGGTLATGKFGECVKALAAQWNNFSFDERAVIVADFDVLSEIEDRSPYQDTILNYLNPAYNEWPKDVIFTTVYPQIANIYGKNVLLYKDHLLRGMDLEHYNEGLNGIFNKWGAPGIDNGEHVFMDFMLPEELVGFQIMNWESGDLYDGSEENRHKKIILGLYKLYTSKGVPYVVVVDGQEKLTCLKPKSATELEACDTHNYKEEFFSPLPAAIGSSLKALAFISSEDLPLEVTLKFKASKSIGKFPLIDQLEKTFTASGFLVQRVENLPANSLEVDNNDVIMVKEATWGANRGARPGNVTTSAKSFCDGKKRCDYKISKKFMKEKDIPGSSKDYELKYACVVPGTKAIPDKAKIVTKKVWADSEDKMLSLFCSDSED